MANIPTGSKHGDKAADRDTCKLVSVAHDDVDVDVELIKLKVPANKLAPKQQRHLCASATYFGKRR